MNRQVCLVLVIIFTMTAPVLAGDLYRVAVGSQAEADRLAEAGIDPVVRLTDGYLVIADGETVSILERTGLKIQFVVADVSRDQLAIDGRLDEANLSRYPVLFQEDNLRLYRVDWPALARAGEPAELAPVTFRPIKIEYVPPRTVDMRSFEAYIDLDSLISLVEQDSLAAYTERLQAYYRRVVGTDSCYASADWTIEKFQSFGYDSVYSDTFTSSIWGTPTLIENTVAVKLGTRFPERYIIVGGHRDGVSGSPAADDNGSGTAATLEVARILADIETFCSFIFITFDGEEVGLYGSEHYAENAAVNGDTIIWMLNFDMIAHYENSTQAKLYHGADVTYSELWQELAEPLVGLSGVLSGSSGGSDHYPFAQEGYAVTFVHEYIFSDVYHGNHDSTTYMNFEYMTKMVKASLATAYSVMLDATAPLIEFSYPGGAPEFVIAGEHKTFGVNLVLRNGAVAVPGSGKLYYSVDGGPFSMVPMTSGGGTDYEGTLPAVSCNNVLEFYISADEAETGAHYDGGPGNAHAPIVATEVAIPLADDFETDLGWTISGGLWERGDPTGGGGDHGGPDPVGGHNSSNCFGYNLDGDYENSMPERHLTSPAFDCTGLSGVQLKFWRWLGVERPAYDHAYVRISTNGSIWTTIWENSAEVADAAWIEMVFDISALVDDQPNVYLRFTMGETDGLWTFCGWNIDDVMVSAYKCDDQADSDGDGILDVLDNCVAAYNPLQEDGDLDAVGDSCDLCTDSDDDGYGDPGYPRNQCLLDNCPDTANPEQLDPDADGFGSACDNCPDAYNPGQVDSDGDDIGDACDFICGDADGSGLVNITDAVYLISFIFSGGPAPDPVAAGDPNCDELVNVSDAVYLVAYIFGGGPEPCAACL